MEAPDRIVQVVLVEQKQVAPPQQTVLTELTTSVEVEVEDQDQRLLELQVVSVATAVVV
jgi:hypothetical protein